MKSDTVNRWLSLVANIGVVIGLIVLIVEVRYAITLAESEAYRQRGTEIQEALKDLALSESLAAIQVKARREGVSALTETEHLRLSAWAEAIALRMQNQFNDYQSGLLDESSYRSIILFAPRILTMLTALEVDLIGFNPDFIGALRSASEEVKQN